MYIFDEKVGRRKFIKGVGAAAAVASAGIGTKAYAEAGKTDGKKPKSILGFQ